MKKIFKYRIDPKPTVQSFELPLGAHIVALREQNVGELNFWAIVDPKQKKVEVKHLLCAGTGWELIPEIVEHIDTCVSMNGFVWHLLEVE